MTSAPPYLLPIIIWSRPPACLSPKASCALSPPRDDALAPPRPHPARYTICSSDNCKGYWAVYRISFSLALFFFMMMLFTMCRSKGSTHLHLGFW